MGTLQGPYRATFSTGDPGNHFIPLPMPQFPHLYKGDHDDTEVVMTSKGMLSRMHLLVSTLGVLTSKTLLPPSLGILGGLYLVSLYLQTVGIQGPAPHTDGSSSLDPAKALSIPRYTPGSPTQYPHPDSAQFSQIFLPLSSGDKMRQTLILERGQKKVEVESLDSSLMSWVNIPAALT